MLISVEELLLRVNVWYINATLKQTVFDPPLVREDVLCTALVYYSKLPELEPAAVKTVAKLLSCYRSRYIDNVPELVYHFDCLMATVYGVELVHRDGYRLSEDLQRKLNKTLRKGKKQ